MATNRMLIFAPGELYHVFNRGIDRKTIFTTLREYERYIEIVRYYRFANLSMSFSELHKLSVETRAIAWVDLIKKNQKEVEIFSYCLMPNHFHFVLKQLQEGGVSRFIANITNSYTKFFNAKHQRDGHLFEGTFKAVHVETEEQLLHLTRYVHLNPVTSFLVRPEILDRYPWSSFSEYIGLTQDGMCETSWIDSHFLHPEKYKEFVYDQINYAQELHRIKHLSIDE